MQKYNPIAALIPLLIFGASSCGPNAPTGAVAKNPEAASGGAEARSDTAYAPGEAKFLPDANITPGDTLDVTAADVCVSGYSGKVRNVPDAVKQQAYANYGIVSHRPREYEVDHLISLELGGSNSIKNLWPESYETQPWNAHVKDKLENELHRLICSGMLDLKTAQQEISTDWIASYKKHFHTDKPLNSGSRMSQEYSGSNPVPVDSGNSEAGTPPGDDKVWVNTNSGKYWQPGTRYYGRTKEGEYMTEAEAKKRGFTPARFKE